MRLLHLDHSGKLVSTDFHGKPIPPYGILSHRWGDSEVLFEDLGSEAYKEKKDGYQKLEFCAQQAAQDQLQYFWIDTCCIDKWNNRERSRAINLMYRWYRNATRCYVFLSDVSISDVSISSATETPQQRGWEASFRASKWFTRGWTLQELIAPVSVEFFSCEGVRLGDKTSLEQLVYEITSIPRAALRNRPLDQFARSERIRWAINRTTTEEEDHVYCLLGILGVSLPISYGEGREKALRRLQIESEAVEEAEETAKVAVSAPSIIPFSRNDSFVGREPQLAELEAKLFSDKQNNTLAIVGPGGTGKSQLALEFAYRTRQKNKNCSVFWIDASDIDSLYQSYSRIAEKLNIPGWDDDKADIMQLVKLRLERKEMRQHLLIFDNTNEIAFASNRLSAARAANPIDHLPQSQMCSTIFTTTDSKTAKRLASQNLIELQELTPGAAQRMLENYLTTPISSSEQQETKLLLQELSCLPLAIVQAAAYMNTKKMTLQKYQLQLDEQKERTLQQGSEVSSNKLQGYSARNPVATTLFISLDEICRSKALAADYLFLAACIDRKDIPLDLLEAPEPEREDALRVLSRYELITRRPAESALDLHDLVHSALRFWLQNSGLVDQWTERAITRVLQVYPDNDHSSRSKWRRLIPHASSVLSHEIPERNNKDRLSLAWKYAMTLLSDGWYDKAEKLFVQVIETRERVLGDEHSDTLTSIANLASTYWNQGRLKVAEELQAKELEICLRVLGDKHPDTLMSMANLGSTYRDQGRWKEAEELFVQVVQTRKRVLGDEHPNTLTSTSNLASTYIDQGRWKEAEELFLQVLETRKRVLGDEHPNTLTSINNLALTYTNQGRWKEAEELQVKELEISSRVLGGEHPDTLTSMANLSSTYWNQGQWTEAEELQAKGVEICSKVLGDDHPDTLKSIANLASTYRVQGRWKAAEELFLQVIETRKRVLGDEHPDTLGSINNLALTYTDQGRWKEAEELQAKGVEICSKVLGDDHPDTLTSIANLASTYKVQGQWKAAEELFLQVIETRKRVLGDEHPNTLGSMNNLAITYTDQGRWKEAEELQARGVEIYSRVLGDEHPDTLTSMANLALTYMSQGWWKEAEELLVHVLKMRKRVLGDEHPNTLPSMANLALTYTNQGRWKEAEELQVKELEISSRVLGGEHPDTLTSMANLAYNLKSQSRDEEALSLLESCFQLHTQILGEHHPDTKLLLAISSEWQVENSKLYL